MFIQYLILHLWVWDSLTFPEIYLPIVSYKIWMGTLLENIKIKRFKIRRINLKQPRVHCYSDRRVWRCLTRDCLTQDQWPIFTCFCDILMQIRGPMILLILNIYCFQRHYVFHTLEKIVYIWKQSVPRKLLYRFDR